jgi:hypothetical protein
MSDTANYVSEKGIEETRVEDGHVPVHVIKTVHEDGTVDFVDAHAVGGDFEDMPKGYFYSLSFIMTFTVSLVLSTTIWHC